jgi:AAA lid domain
MLEQQRYRLDDPAKAAFGAYLQRRMALPDFANARSVRNAIDRIKLRQANRIYSGSGLATREELERIDAADILKSRVFLAGPAVKAPDDPLTEVADA